MTEANHGDEQRLRFSRHCPRMHVPIEYSPAPPLFRRQIRGYTGRFNDLVVFRDGAACGVAFGVGDFLLLQNGMAPQHVALILLTCISVRPRLQRHARLREVHCPRA